VNLITLAAAQAIAKIALDKFVESGAGELGKTMTAAIAQKVERLGNEVTAQPHSNYSTMS